MKSYDEMNFDERVAWCKGEIIMAIGRGEDIKRPISLMLLVEGQAIRAEVQKKRKPRP